MGVQGLWTVVQPCARPVKLETLAQKRLAIDASIWIYQFLKAVRDKEGNALRNAHVVGFFRRIVKLLFHGIRPVFVFDGGAPLLKRQTIAGRKQRREGRREDATRTAGKLLSVQMQRRAKEEVERQKRARERSPSEPVEIIPENVVYAEEVFQTKQERAKSRKFRKSDPYHLPEMDPMSMAGGSDPRIMSQEELAEYARQFEGGEDISLYDFSKIDFDSPFFVSLPAADRYNILNAARLRSRLRMGLSKEQLDRMFPNRLDFSKFQIERVKERNELTQRLMNLNGMNADLIGVNRVAGEKNREYVLVKNDGVDGGWALGVVGNRSEREGENVKTAIDVDAVDEEESSDEDEDMDDFEDVPIDGLNRLPVLPAKKPPQNRPAWKNAPRRSVEDKELDELFEEPTSGTRQRLQLEKSDSAGLFIQEDDFDNLDEDEELRRAISMSLQKDAEEGENEKSDMDDDERLRLAIEMSERKDKSPDVLVIEDEPQKAMKKPVADDDGFDLDFAIEMSREKETNSEEPKKIEPSKKPENKFGGLLPFESLNFSFGGGLAGMKKKKEKEKEMATEEEEKNKEPPLPPWFNAGESSAFKEGHIEYSRPDRQEYDVFVPRSPVKPKKAKIVEPIIIDSDDEKDSDIEMIEVPLPVDKPANSNAFPKATTKTRETNPQENEPEEKQDEQLVVIEPEISNEDDVELLDVATASPQPPTIPTMKSPTPPNHKSLSPEQQLPPALPLQEKELEDDESSSDSDSDHGETYSDPEDEELFRQLDQENREHARFASTFNHKPAEDNEVDYERELRSLRNQQKKDRRDADEVTFVMIKECQELLRLFGIPYITAPMEAEAQCAELVRLGLVDGIVTDDSDIFLFGGNRVYKNMFNQAKFVECYLATDLENEYSLDRRKLIRLAHLLGSDYTDGLPGVGPVTALELLAEFATEDGLVQFKNWWMHVQSGVKDDGEDARSKFKKKFRKLSEKLFLPASFPDERVDIAYLDPEVDKDPSTFEWGVPDLDGLRTYLMDLIGWSPEKTDETLVPVIRDMNRKLVEGAQVNITNFFSGGTGAGAFAPRVREQNKSKRMANALQTLHDKSLQQRAQQEAAERGAEGSQSRSRSSSIEVAPPISMRAAFAALDKRVDEGKEKGKKRKTTAPTKSSSAAAAAAAKKGCGGKKVNPRKRRQEEEEEEDEESDYGDESEDEDVEIDDGDEDDEVTSPTAKKPRTRKAAASASKRGKKAAPSRTSGRKSRNL